jgi:hypothetical protein
MAALTVLDVDVDRGVVVDSSAPKGQKFEISLNAPAFSKNWKKP